MPSKSISANLGAIPGVDPNRTFNTGIPGFDELSRAAGSNVQDLLSGTESPDISRNLNATWGAQAGVPGSEFLRNRGADLYGQRAAARKRQGLGDLLSLLQGYSGTVVASPASIIGQEEGAANRALSERMSDADRGQRQYEFGRTFPESQRQFNMQYGLNALNAGSNAISNYMNWLQ